MYMTIEKLYEMFLQSLEVKEVDKRVKDAIILSFAFMIVCFKEDALGEDLDKLIDECKQILEDY